MIMIFFDDDETLDFQVNKKHVKHLYLEEKILMEKKKPNQFVLYKAVRHQDECMANIERSRSIIYR